MIPTPFLLSAGLLALVAQTGAQQSLPYNPTRIISANNGSLVYVFAPQQSSKDLFSMSLLDTSKEVKSTTGATQLFNSLPFLSGANSEAFIPLADNEGVTVLAGDCQQGSKGVGLWTFKLNEKKNNGTWSKLQTGITDTSLSTNFLSAGFTFSPTNSEDDASVYVFGGMCPNGSTSNPKNWVSAASYSNTILTISPDSSSNAGTPYHLSVSGSRAPPIPEAGLTVTPLLPTFSDGSSSNDLQQQNFVLLGGHTENAFINMSQVALYSLPQESWAFLGVDDPSDPGDGELVKRASDTVEPRSGHTAVMTEDGTKIVVFGGWVGDISTPAQPQLAILNIGQGYGGLGPWQWSIPSSPSPLGSGDGVFGHGAAMLPGGIMMVAGGQSITQSGSKLLRRSSSDFLFFNTTSTKWINSYTNSQSPQSPTYTGDGKPHSSGGLKTSQKAGLGAGIGLGLAAAALLVVFWLLYSRRLRQQRAIREKELRELALGAERYHSPSLVGDSDDHRYPQMRSASWNSMQERRIEGPATDTYPWAPVVTSDQANRMRMEQSEQDGNGLRQAERTGVLMDVPSPTRGLRRSLHSRGPVGIGGFQSASTGAPGSVFRIDEEEEERSQGGSLKKSKTPNAAGDRSSVHSDPFKDPPPPLDSTNENPAAVERKREVQGWVEDWASVAESMNLSRNPSQAHSHGRTYSNLSQAYTNSHSSSDPSGRGSPEKSDRTGSNLSERSIISTSSLQRSVAGTLSRNISMRSASAGYALFSGAAAAMGRLAGSRTGQQQDYGTATSNVARAPSQRSISLNLHPSTSISKSRDRAETFSSAKSTIGPVILAGEDQALLGRMNTKELMDDYWTPPESPVKEKYARAGSLTSSSRRAHGILGSVRRVFTGTGSVDVQDKVASLEFKASPTKQSEMSEISPTTANSPTKSLPPSAGAGFWHGKRGAKDWKDPTANPSASSSTTQPNLPPQQSSIRRKPVPGQQPSTQDDHNEILDDEDWDVETAIQKRVVQVMFTVPKEKLRVVNADALSLLSSNRSEVDFEEEKERERDVKRMSSVRETDGEMDHEGIVDEKGKGKEDAHPMNWK